MPSLSVSLRSGSLSLSRQVHKRRGVDIGPSTSKMERTQTHAATWGPGRELCDARVQHVRGDKPAGGLCINGKWKLAKVAIEPFKQPEVGHYATRLKLAELTA